MGQENSATLGSDKEQSKRERLVSLKLLLIAMVQQKKQFPSLSDHRHMRTDQSKHQENIKCDHFKCVHMFTYAVLQLKSLL